MKKVILFLVLISNLIYSQEIDYLVLKKSNYSKSSIIKSNTLKELLKVSDNLIEEKYFNDKKIIYNELIYFDNFDNIDSIVDNITKKTIKRYKKVYDSNKRLVELSNDSNSVIIRFTHFDEKNYIIKESYDKGGLFSKVEFFYKNNLIIKEKITSFYPGNDILDILLYKYSYNSNNDVDEIIYGYIYYNSIKDEDVLIYFKPNIQNFEYVYNKDNFWVNKIDIRTKEETIRKFEK